MANDFSGDVNALALYNFEDGALTVDSKGSNTLTANNSPSSNLIDYKQGLASVDLTGSTEDTFSITDVDLPTGFPLKFGETNTTFSICGWFKQDVLATAGIVSKYESSTDDRSFAFGTNSGGSFFLSLGYNSGASLEKVIDGSGSTSVGQWYHFKVTFNAGAWSARVWGETEGAEVLNSSGTWANTLSIVEVPWYIGRYFAGYAPFDGKLDEFVFFDRVVSDTDQDSIIAGTYSATPTPSDVAILRRRRSA